MCDVIKIRLKRRVAAIKIKAPPGNPSFKIGLSSAVLIFSDWFPFPTSRCNPSFGGIFMTSHITLSSASIFLTPKSGPDCYPPKFLIDNLLIVFLSLIP